MGGTSESIAQALPATLGVVGGGALGFWFVRAMITRILNQHDRYKDQIADLKTDIALLEVKLTDSDTIRKDVKELIGDVKVIEEKIRQINKDLNVAHQRIRDLEKGPT